MSRILARLSAVLLAVVLAASPVFAAGGRLARAERQSGLVSSVWQFLENLIPAIGKAHGTMDPDGGNPSPAPTSGATSGAPVVDSDAHGTMDPNGGA